MFNTHISHIIKVRNTVFFCKLPTGQALLCRLNIFIWCKVVHHQCNLFSVKYSIKSSLLHFTNGNRTCNIICKRQIHRCFNELSCLHGRKPACFARIFCVIVIAIITNPPSFQFVDTVDICLNRCLDNIYGNAAVQ